MSGVQRANGLGALLEDAGRPPQAIAAASAPSQKMNVPIIDRRPSDHPLAAPRRQSYVADELRTASEAAVANCIDWDSATRFRSRLSRAIAAIP